MRVRSFWYVALAPCSVIAQASNRSPRRSPSVGSGGGGGCGGGVAGRPVVRGAYPPDRASPAAPWPAGPGEYCRVAGGGGSLAALAEALAAASYLGSISAGMAACWPARK